MSKMPFAIRRNAVILFPLFSVKSRLSDCTKRNMFFTVFMRDYEMYFPLSRSFSHPVCIQGDGKGRLTSECKDPQSTELEFYTYVSSSAASYQLSFSTVFSHLEETKQCVS